MNILINKNIKKLGTSLYFGVINLHLSRVLRKTIKRDLDYVKALERASHQQLAAV